VPTSAISPAFLSTLEVEILDEELFRLVRPFKYRSAVLGALLVIPEGFLTDLSSVPRLPLIYWLYGGRARKAAVPHDFLYQTHSCTKEEADEVFREAMALLPDLPAHARWAMYQGVCLGGEVSWESGPRRYTVLGNAARAGEM
jgi:hypothetical protein